MIKLYLDKLTPEQVKRLADVYSKSLDTYEGIVIGHDNPVVSEDHLEQPLQWEVIEFRGEQRAVVVPDYAGPSLLTQQDRVRLQSILIPVILPLKGTYFEVSKEEAKEIKG